MSVPSGMGYAGLVAVPIPPDQPAGNVLTKVTDANYDMEWLAPSGGGGSDSESIRELNTASTQLDTDDYISATGPFDFSLISSALAMKGFTLKSETGGGIITMVRDGTDTIDGIASDFDVPAGAAVRFTPIIGGWSVS